MAINLKAIDLSHHNLGPNGGAIDFGAIAGFGIRAVILKATQGVRTKDPTFDQRRADALSEGLLVGAYDFNTGDPAQDQVNFMLDTVKPDANTMCALDFEDNSASQMSLSLCLEYLQLADAQLGRPFWFYSGNRIKALIPQAADDSRAFLATHPLWGCEYGLSFKMIDENHNPLPWSRVTLWQFAGDGVNSQGIVVPGLSHFDSTKVDMNNYMGTDEQLAQDWVGGEH